MEKLKFKTSRAGSAGFQGRLTERRGLNHFFFEFLDLFRISSFGFRIYPFGSSFNT